MNVYIATKSCIVVLTNKGYLIPIKYLVLLEVVTYQK
jgi:hypothetical protein